MLYSSSLSWTAGQNPNITWRLSCTQLLMNIGSSSHSGYQQHLIQPSPTACLALAAGCGYFPWAKPNHPPKESWKTCLALAVAVSRRLLLPPSHWSAGPASPSPIGWPRRSWAWCPPAPWRSLRWRQGPWGWPLPRVFTKLMSGYNKIRFSEIKYIWKIKVDVFL